MGFSDRTAFRIRSKFLNHPGGFCAGYRISTPAGLGCFTCRHNEPFEQLDVQLRNRGGVENTARAQFKSPAEERAPI